VSADRETERFVCETQRLDEQGTGAVVPRGGFERAAAPSSRCTQKKKDSALAAMRRSSRSATRFSRAGRNIDQRLRGTLVSAAQTRLNCRGRRRSKTKTNPGLRGRLRVTAGWMARRTEFLGDSFRENRTIRTCPSSNSICRGWAGADPGCSIEGVAWKLPGDQLRFFSCAPKAGRVPSAELSWINVYADNNFQLRFNGRKGGRRRRK